VTDTSTPISSWWQIILNIGSVSGLIALAYTIFSNLRRRPKFKFDFSSRGGDFSEEGNLLFDTLKFTGTLKNQSLDPNSISKIYLVVWKNRKLNETLRFGYGGVTIKNTVNNEEIKLPLSFAPREAMALEIKCKFAVTGTPDDELLDIRGFVPIRPGSKFLRPKYDYELAFEDVNENLFDQKGELCNSEEKDLRWTLPNSTRDINNSIYLPFIKHKFKIAWSRVKFRWKIILQSFGLWK
jgi:hypothetical protein